MASILFVENREKTGLWEQVALNLRTRGHDIAWLVQNPLFAPKAFAGEVQVLPFPRTGAGDATTSDESWIDAGDAAAADRGRRYFNAGTAHYAHYAQAIDRVLSRRPDVVVGESTLFHELIAIDRCRATGIDYLHPCANRYPGGRFSLFAFDTQIPAAGSSEVWPEAAALELAERIAGGREVPFYMRSLSHSERPLRQLRWIITRARVWRGRLGGERYNTPSLRRKLALWRQVRANLAQWRLREGLPAQAKRTILYPLQLQPEANMDVWGRPYSDQVAFIRALLAAAPSGVQIAVKANPKAKYELSDALLALAAAEPRICLLPLNMPMTEAHKNCIGAVTVCGTVGLESVFGRGRCLSLRHPVLEREFPGFHASTPAEAMQRLLNEPAAGVGNPGLGAQLIRRLVAQSFPGLVSDTFSHPECLDPANVAAIADVLHDYVTGRPRSAPR